MGDKKLETIALTMTSVFGIFLRTFESPGAYKWIHGWVGHYKNKLNVPDSLNI